MILVVGVSHKTAPIEVRERIAIAGDRMSGFLATLREQPELGETFVVSTCNRVEIYATAASKNDTGAAATKAIEQVLIQEAGPEVGAVLHQYLFRYIGDAAVRHLFRVAASLDSLVVGESQVLGQVKDAFDRASHNHTLGPILGRALEWSFHVAKRVRTETQVGAGTVSVSSIAVDLARQIFGGLKRRVVVLIGAGTMAEAAAQHLTAAGSRLLVVNRSLDRASSVAARFEGTALPWDQLDDALVEADVVIASTGSPDYVVTRKGLAALRRRRRGRSLFVVDIAVPRNVDPSINKLDGVYLYDIDDLSKIASETARGRFVEAQVSERIVAEEADEFEAWLDSLHVTPTIVALRNQVRAVLEAELDRSLHAKLKHLNEHDRKALEDMVGAAVKKLTHHPTVRLKTAAAEGGARSLVDALENLFDLDHDVTTRTRNSTPPDRDDPPDSNPETSSRTRSVGSQEVVRTPERHDAHAEEAQ